MNKAKKILYTTLVGLMTLPSFANSQNLEEKVKSDKAVSSVFCLDWNDENNNGKAEISEMTDYRKDKTFYGDESPYFILRELGKVNELNIYKGSKKISTIPFENERGVAKKVAVPNEGPGKYTIKFFKTPIAKYEVKE